MARILVIDDDDQIRAMLQQVLQREGYEVIEAADGKPGMRLFRERGAELIITDIIMPEKEGLETIMELRRDFPSVKIIAMSGGGHVSPKEYLYLAKKLGAQHTLCKPFTRQEILRAIRDVLDKGVFSDQ
ncbi:MAG: response regulator [Desulfobacterales bacterium]|nr:response regulator [Desulfobacterales bacterium]